ncbi:hypothetical protein ABE485_28010 [Achromobacter spanius]|uniref:hypothetical protein n=1 Tax=Achromobacter spanius TaxID=217203 RepID=UPI00320AE336
MTSNLQYLRCLIRQKVADESEEWPRLLLEVIESPDIEELSSNPQVYKAAFIKERAEQRHISSSVQGLITFGIPALINRLKCIADDENIELFGLRNSTYVGACFIYEEQLIGCEFVVRGKAKTRPGLWLDFQGMD